MTIDQLEEIKSLVLKSLTPDLLNPYWRKKQDQKKNDMVGHCYVATEACFYLIGGKDNGFYPYVLNNKTYPEGLEPDEVHWFLRKRECVIDLTSGQFSCEIPYDKAKKQAFLTKNPSKRAVIVMKRVDMLKKKNVDLVVDWATYKAAKYACETWHYSKCLPTGKLVKVGAWEKGRFIGVVLFGRGATPNLGKPYGLSQTECVELVRIALSEHESFVSKIMMVAVKMLKSANPKIRLVVSFADSSQGHHGGIYQSTNWIYTGVGNPAKFYKIHGKITHPRSLGARGVSQSIDGAIKLDSEAAVIIVPGKHRYLMPLDKKMRKQVLPLSKPYPKRSKQAMDASSITAKGQNLSDRSKDSGRL